MLFVSSKLSLDMFDAIGKLLVDLKAVMGQLQAPLDVVVKEGF